jgi:uncharacterized membrane protein
MRSSLAFRTILRNPKTLAMSFAASGLLHLAAPQVYEGIVPRWLPQRRGLVYVSGVAEVVCAGGLFSETSWAGPLSAGLLLAIWPANIQMAVDATAARRSFVRQFLAWSRVPLQVPMIRVALRSNRCHRRQAARP